MRVLLVEDHVELARTIAGVLRREGMAVDLAFDGQQALDRAAVSRYDVIVLDRDLPVVHGDDVCRSIMSDGSESRVLMLTAAGSLEERVGGLGLGADDYLPKPFAFVELVARIRALARRGGTPVPPTLVSGDLRVDPAQRTAVRAGRPLELSRKELAVLEYLLAAQGRPVTAEELLEHVWDEAADPFTTTVKVTIRRLRTKLGDPPLIETVAQGGYRI
ncbi:MAG TPA: response regulator transcription factor [Acidothermaceae bacterium]